MKLLSALVLAIAAPTLAGAQGASAMIHGTVKKIDEGAKTVAIATANGAEEVVEFGDKTIVHGTVAGAKGAFRGLTEGAEVVAWYTASGAKKVAVEVDKVGKDGMKAARGTVTKVDAAAKTVGVKMADGTEQVFHATERAGAEIAKGSVKTGQVTVHYTEEGGRKIAHLFSSTF